MKWFVNAHVSVTNYLIIGAVIISVCNSAENVSIDDASTDSGRSFTPDPSDVVSVEVYYESLCYDSIQFVKNQLVPTHQQLADFMKVTFVPYGKASHEKRRDANGVEKWHFSCQHGSAECYGNKAQACAINDILTNFEKSSQQQQRDLVNLVGCVMSARNPSNAVPQCAETIGLDANHRSLINGCITSANGDNLLAAHGDRTHNVQPVITFVPTIIINGIYTHENQRESLHNLKSTVCGYIPAGIKPQTCNG